MHDDEPTQDEPTQDAEVRRALDAWSALVPSADFADRVLAARDDAPAPRRRTRLHAGGIIAGAAAAAAVVAALALRSPGRAASGNLIATQRTTAQLGDRGVAVAEPTTEVTWRVTDDGAAEITQRTGNVFYRVERGGPFVVHTTAGDIHVTGTCFRIEVLAMTPHKKLLFAGLTGAAVASTVLVTVYEGRVIAQTRAARSELSAGSHAALRGDDASIAIGAPPGAPTVASRGAPTDDPEATREQLLARARAQQVELTQLRTRIAELERAAPGARGGDVADDDPGRPWHDPSPETLAAWAAKCHVRADNPSLDQFTPLRRPDTGRGMEPGEVDAYNEAISEVATQWRDLVRSLYLEITGDAAGADTLSVAAMRREIEDKTPREEGAVILQKLSRERAGLASPPADLGKTSTLERLLRAFVKLGDQSEAALARRIGAERAHAIRGEGWGTRSDSAECPPQSPAQ
jgi:hypothetical protein